MGAEWSTVREKRLIQRIVALHAAAEDAEAISFVSEAWVSSPRQGPDESDAAYLRRVESAQYPAAEHCYQMPAEEKNKFLKNKTVTPLPDVSTAVSSDPQLTTDNGHWL